MGKTCSSCAYANRAGSEDYVFCRFWQSQANESGLSSEEFINKKLFKETSIEGVGIGWVYPKVAYSGAVAWHEKGTASAGIMWSEQICISKDEGCHKHKSLGTP